jgi:hypothetical protein
VPNLGTDEAPITEEADSIDSIKNKMQEEKIYFDNNATTILHPDINAYIGKNLPSAPLNPSSVHHYGQIAANIISADAGLTVYVIGSNNAIASAGPMPGSTPTSVPRNVPSKPKPRLLSVSALAKPSKREFRLLIRCLPKYPPAKRH